MIANSAKGKIWYGMHFYPGTAQYLEPGKEPLMVFLNENTIRRIGPTFEGRPVYVHHVDDVSDDIKAVKREADGFVVESFYNEADGKHWVKFITLSENADKAIQNGWKLSNAYIPTTFGQPGTWNGITYHKEITNAEYEHLAIVPNPRYEESVIMSPDEFKRYNESEKEKLKILRNHKGATSMFSLFKRQKVENSESLDLENTLVVLPKSKIEMSISKVINVADEFEATKNDIKPAHSESTVKVGDETMKVGELVEKFAAVRNELEALKIANKKSKKNDDDEDEDDDSMDNADDDCADPMENEDDDSADPKEKKLKKAADEDKEMKNKKKNKKKNEADADDDEDDEAGRERAKRLMNARSKKDALENGADDDFHFITADSQVSLGKKLFGSN